MLRWIRYTIHDIWCEFAPLLLAFGAILVIIPLVIWAVHYDAEVEKARENEFVEYCMQKVQTASEEDCRWEYRKNYKEPEKQGGTTMMPIIIPMR